MQGHCDIQPAFWPNFSHNDITVHVKLATQAQRQQVLEMAGMVPTKGSDTRPYKLHPATVHMATVMNTNVSHNESGAVPTKAGDTQLSSSGDSGGHSDYNNNCIGLYRDGYGGDGRYQGSYKSLRCYLCHGDHHISHCIQYPDPVSKRDRLKVLGKCEDCHKPSHPDNLCALYFKCRICTKGYHYDYLCCEGSPGGSGERVENMVPRLVDKPLTETSLRMENEDEIVKHNQRFLGNKESLGISEQRPIDLSMGSTDRTHGAQQDKKLLLIQELQHQANILLQRSDLFSLLGRFLSLCGLRCLKLCDLSVAACLHGETSL